MQCLVVGRSPACKLDQDSICGPQAPIRSPAVFPASFEPYGPSIEVEGTRLKLTQFSCEDFLKSESTSCYQSKHRREDSYWEALVPRSAVF